MSTVTPSQPREAVQEGTRRRMVVRAFKARLKASSKREAILEAARVLIEEPELATGVRVYAFLEAVPGVGRGRARKLLTRHGIYAAKLVRELTNDQRTLLAGELVRHAGGLGGGNV